MASTRSPAECEALYQDFEDFLSAPTTPAGAAAFVATVHEAYDEQQDEEEGGDEVEGMESEVGYAPGLHTAVLSRNQHSSSNCPRSLQ